MAIRRITRVIPIGVPQQATVQKRSGLTIKPKPAVKHPILDFEQFVEKFPRKDFLRPEVFVREWLFPYMTTTFRCNRWDIKVYPITRDHIGGMTEIIGMTVFFVSPGIPLTNCKKLNLTCDKALWLGKITRFATMNVPKR